MILRLASTPAVEPVSIEEAKAHLRLESDEDDDYVETLIQGAREVTEKSLGRGLVTQTWELTLDEFPDEEEIELPKGALASVTSVQYLDANGVLQTLATTEYEVDSKSEPGKVRLAYAKSWPTTRERWNAVRVTYVVGTAAAAVPKPIYQAMLLLISQAYEHRTPEVTGTIVSKVEFSFSALLAPYRIFGS